MADEDIELVHSQDSIVSTTHHDSRHTHCDLCYYIGGTNATFNSIPKYVHENVDKVHIDEICKQIAKTILKDVNIEISVARIKQHIEHHTLDRKVLNCMIHKDLRFLMKTTGKLCVVRDTETNAEAIDHKATSTYLDVVKQIMSVSKSN